jgi:hypothetical protein
MAVASLTLLGTLSVLDREGYAAAFGARVRVVLFFWLPIVFLSAMIGNALAGNVSP